MTFSSSSVARPQVLVCALTRSETLFSPIDRALERYCTVVLSSDAEAFFKTVVRDRFSIDCLILEQQPDLERIIGRLHREAIVLPLVILTDSKTDRARGLAEPSPIDSIGDTSRYHTAEVELAQSKIQELPQSVDTAIANFLKLSPQSRLPHQSEMEFGVEDRSALSSFGETLAAQQQRLSDKLRERLGYLGVFYKRDSQLFFRNFSSEERESFLLELKSDYRDIILSYFRKGSDINQQIDAFVYKVFFADMSVSQVLEIHMELMDRLAKKLKLEGRSEDILLDYRLTLIDAIAHLCEMYRRSIPKEP
ncbi:circadian clock protein KaiA [Altericista sp. CCNU0014]|uniref:circadian clock protein KaiA n=1 Tax=Altericista sp. CCNU0014 TaxID=3082949 RepID=UPI0038514FDE